MLKFIPSIHTNNYKYKKNPTFCFHWPLIKDHTKKRKPKNEGREALNSSVCQDKAEVKLFMFTHLNKIY